MNSRSNASRPFASPALTAVIVAAGVLTGPQIAGAQPPPAYASLHAFAGGGNRGPSSLIKTSEGLFIGTTSSGGAAGAGTIFQMWQTADGAHVRVLHTFAGATEGAGPETALLEGSNVTFYGTTPRGGAFNAGTLYRVNRNYTVTVLHAFAGGDADGAAPSAALIRASDGNLYGTTALGGTFNAGTVFRMTLAGAFSVVHSFAGYPADGAHPRAALLQASDGNFYGTTSSGGAAGGGTVFRMTPDGTVTVLHSFSYADGDRPEATLIQAADGQLYGTTSSGGAFGDGTVFRMTLAGTVTTLHSFNSAIDGGGPASALLQVSDDSYPVFDLYGTTTDGGASGGGTVFRMTPDGSLTVLRAFGAGSYGINPSAALIRGDDQNLYGTTSSGGPFKVGTVFKVTPAGATTLVHAFSYTDGELPYGDLVQATDGNLYGVTLFGGTSDAGTVFRMTPAGIITILHAFGGAPGDGARPDALIQGSDGNFYGATAWGGALDSGTIFRMTPNGVVTVLYDFRTGTNGLHPTGLIQASDGNFYGTAAIGPSGYLYGGSIFRMTPSGTVATLHQFTGGTSAASLIQAADGNFYGTSAGTAFRMTAGGAFTVLHRFSGTPSALLQATDGDFYAITYAGGTFNAGTVFRMTSGGDVTVLHDFNGAAEGANPVAGLLQASDGNFYGTTVNGGASGAGTIFRMTPEGGLTVLHNFLETPADGVHPAGALVQGVDGNLYGTTQEGGASGAGIVFRLAVGSPAFTVQPVNHRVGAGQTAVFTAAASGTPAPTYQWQVLAGGSVWVSLPEASPYSGVTTPILTITGVTAALNANRYRALAINTLGTVPSAAAALIVTPPLVTIPGDFDGDARPDLTIYRPSTGMWYVLTSSSGFTAGRGYAWGTSTDIPVSGDYDGDGRVDVAVYRPSTGTWWILKSSAQYTTAMTLQWGAPGDQPMPADYDGDGQTDLAIYRPSTGAWYLLTSTSGYTSGFGYFWGSSTDLPMPGDYDGDGRADIVVYRPHRAGNWPVWFILKSSSNYTTWTTQGWGGEGDIPVPGDYDGDGKTDLATYRPAIGTWLVHGSSSGLSFLMVEWGVSTDLPVPHDFDGDGRTDVTVYRPSTGVWFILKSSTNFTAWDTYQWGTLGDVPIGR